LEYYNTSDVIKRTKEIYKTCNSIGNLAIMHHHVVVVDGIAVLGVNGWYGNTTYDEETASITEVYRNEDILYVKNTLERLQKHLDVKKIVIVSNSVPGIDLYFGEHPDTVDTQLNLNIALLADTENKVSHWLYGTYGKVVDTNINDINYINNGSFKRNPYWAKRITIEI
jgi:hypothetical protein